jgi:hypothetical protein
VICNGHGEDLIALRIWKRFIAGILNFP